MNEYEKKRAEEMRRFQEEAKREVERSKRAKKYKQPDPNARKSLWGLSDKRQKNIVKHILRKKKAGY